MAQYVIVIESGYKTTSANYHITPTEPMGLEQAQELYSALRAGTHKSLPGEAGATVVDLSDRQFLRIRSVRAATILDRVTMGRATAQAPMVR